MDWILRLAALVLIWYAVTPKYEMITYCIQAHPAREFGLGYFKDGVLIRGPKEDVGWK